MRLSDDKLQSDKCFWNYIFRLLLCLYMLFLSGLVDFDCDGSSTFITQNGSRVIDYFV